MRVPLMSKFIEISNPVTISSSSGTLAYLTTKLNNKTVCIPIMHSASNSLDLLSPTQGMNLTGSTLYTGETPEDGGVGEVEPYLLEDGSMLGIGVKIGGDDYAFPIYEVLPNSSDVITMEFREPTLVTDLYPVEGNGAGTIKSLVFSINNSNYGIPMYKYESIFDPRTNTVSAVSSLTGESASAAKITTAIGIGKPTLDFGSEYGGTYLNSKITAYSDLIDRVKKIFGYPTVEVDVCDENIAEFIDQAIELYTHYAGYKEEYLIFDVAKHHQKGMGVRLDRLFSFTPSMAIKNRENGRPDFDYDLQDYRKVMGCFDLQQGQSSGVNTLFTLEQAMAQQTYFSYLLGSYGFDLVTWNSVKNWLETREKVLAQQIYWQFDDQTQYLRIIPEPIDNQSYCAVVGAYVELPIKQLLSKMWIYKYTVALVSIAMGRTRSKYTYTMLGGATLNGDQLLTQGLTEQKDLEEQLFTGHGFIESQPVFIID